MDSFRFVPCWTIDTSNFLDSWIGCIMRRIVDSITTIIFERPQHRLRLSRVNFCQIAVVSGLGCNWVLDWLLNVCLKVSKSVYLRGAWCAEFSPGTGWLSTILSNQSAIPQLLIDWSRLLTIFFRSGVVHLDPRKWLLCRESVLIPASQESWG